MNQLALLFSFLLPSIAIAESRTALIIGCDYKGTGLELPSPVNDAKAVADKLPEVGFDKNSITLVVNPTLDEFTKAVDTFGASLKANGGVGVFYFSGHGAQVDGENYLIPIAAKVSFREHLKTQGLAASYIATSMEGAKNGVNILILDACRSNDLPSAKAKGVTKKGFAQMDGDGILFCFAAKDGQEALDTGKGSVYTNSLLKHLTTPGVGIMDMLTNVRRDVKRLTENKQEPFLYSGLDHGFSFLPNGGVQPTFNSIVPPTDAQPMRRSSEGTQARFNAAAGAPRKPQDLIAGVKTNIAWRSEITVNEEPGMDAMFVGLVSPGKLVFAGIPPNYPLALGIRFPTLRRFCPLPSSLYEGIQDALDDDALKPGWHLQATLYDFDLDGNPELIVALNQWNSNFKIWDDKLKVLVYEFHVPKSEEDLDRQENWHLAGSMNGQHIVEVEGDTLILPIGSKTGDDYIFRKNKFIPGEGVVRDPSGRWKAESIENKSKAPKSTEIGISSKETGLDSNLKPILEKYARQYIEAGALGASIEEEMELYADSVLYYGEGKKSRTEIAKDLEKQRNLWSSERSYTFGRVRSLKIDESRDEATVFFDYTFSLSGPKKHKNGTAVTKIVFKNIYSTPKVIEVNEDKAK